MKNKLDLLVRAAILFLVISFTSFCKKEKDLKEPEQVIISNKIPEVKTFDVTSVAQTTANIGGNVVAEGSASVITRGVCLSTHTQPTIEDRKTFNGMGLNDFSGQVKALTANTTYYLRAYATNAFGTAYGNEVVFTTQKDLDGTVTDADGNLYHSVKIGTQEWLIENLKTTTYQNGDPIPNLEYDAEWGDTRLGAYCYNLNDKTFAPTYGAFYNWYVITDTRKLTPSGWHVPNEIEWNTLISFLGGNAVAGGKLKEVSATTWANPNLYATNEVGFTARGAGARSITGSFFQGTVCAFFWAASEKGGNIAKIIQLLASGKHINVGQFDKPYGLSIRLVKD